MSQTLGYSLSSCVLAAILMTGCSSSATDATQKAGQEVMRNSGTTSISGNQSYVGILPCANCPGIETQLDLLANGTYFLTQTYQDRPDGTFTRMGFWDVDDDRLVLHHNQDGNLIYFATTNGGWLQADTLGNPIVSELNYTLDPKGWQPTQVKKEITGMLTYMADAPSIIECSTGLRFPVVMTPEWLEVERSYLASSNVGGSYLHTTAQVSLTWETPEEGPARHHLRFENLQSMHAGITCGSPINELEHFEWDLVELDGVIPSDLEALLVRPYVRFSGQQLSGHSGCNVMAGPIHLEGDQLSFGAIASTRMFCQDAAEIESRFLQTLEQAVYSSLEGQYWTWYDEEMKRLASFARKPEDE